MGAIGNRSIFGPSVANEDMDYNGQVVQGASEELAGTPTYPPVSYGAMGETGVDDNTTARHQGIVNDHKAAQANELGRAVPGDQSGAGMVIGTSAPLTTKSYGGSDDPNQGTPMKGIAGTDGFSTSGEGDSGDQTGAGKTLG